MFSVRGQVEMFQKKNFWDLNFYKNMIALVE